ncbi:hypothetical protein [Streptomyces sp. NPDC054794]
MTDSQRYHLSLTCDGRLIMHGWWGNEATARRKWTSWIGERGAMPGARIPLTDEAAGAALANWPDE